MCRERDFGFARISLHMAAHCHHFGKSSYAAKSSLKYRPSKVGYSTKADFAASATDAAYTMMSIPFEAVDGKGISLNDLQFANLAYSKYLPTQCDQIWLWVKLDSGNWDYEKWRFKSPEDGWITVGAITKGGVPYGVGTAFDTVYPDGIPVGSAFWFRAYNKATPRTFTASGQVLSENVSRTINRGQFQFVGLPYPTNLKLNGEDKNVDSTNCSNNKYLPTSCDQIWFWTEKPDKTWDYEKWRYRSPEDGWVSVGAITKEGGSHAAGTPFQTVYPDGVSVASGFWFNSYNKAGASSTYDLNFISPIK